MRCEVCAWVCLSVCVLHWVSAMSLTMALYVQQLYEMSHVMDGDRSQSSQAALLL